MRIGIVTTWFERGAAYVSRQFMEVLRQTDTVFIYARGGEDNAKGNPKWDLPNVHWAKKHSGKCELFGSTYIDKSDFISWLKKNAIEAVLFNEQRWFQPMLWCKKEGVKTIAYVDYYTERMIPLYDVFDALICNTQRHAFSFRDHHNALYIKWGTDVTLYKPFDVKNDKITFFHSAGMAPVRKGTDLLIQSFYEIKKRKEAVLLIHTQVSLKQTFPGLSVKIDEMIKEGSIEIVEGTITAPGLYHRGDVYVYPSRLDGIGLTLMEAIASGLAVVSVNNAPMNEFVEDSFGVLCDIEYFYSRTDGYYWPMCVANTNSLTSILSKFIDNEYDLRAMKYNARQYAEKELDFKKNCLALHELFKNTELKRAPKELCQKIDDYDNRSVMIYRSLFPYFYSIRIIISILLNKLFHKK